MELTTNEQKVIRKIVRYYNSLEEMAAHLGIDTDELIGRIKSQRIHLTLEKKSTYSNSRSQIFRTAEEKMASPLFNYPIG
jgi:hypothetical protein